MKQLYLGIAITSVLLSPAYAVVEGETSTIHFTGKIVESTCSLNNPEGQHIDLGTISASTFHQANITSQEKEFSIQLDDCDPTTYTNARITFQGDTVNGNTQLNVTGGATNLGLQILEGSTPLALDGSSSSASKTLGPGTNTFDFKTRYISLDNTVGAGDANANVKFTVEYP
ncbi:fimbrial protein [Enterobacter asburiae]|uniref:fimbrial protein n=1 Tax=Enterobacter asburiae TaxID=61645 RepID=UPI0032AED178